MSTFGLHVINNTCHEIKVTDHHGNEFHGMTPGDSIEAHSEKTIGSIDVPKITTPHDFWGWVYLQDQTNCLRFELYVFIDKKDDNEYRASIGLRSNTTTEDKNNATPYRACYLRAKLDFGNRQAVYTINEVRTCGSSPI
jgi:hypothetical protein